MSRDNIGGIASGFLLFAFVVVVIAVHYEELEKIEPMGSISFGIVIGWVVRFFLNRMKNFTINEFAALISALIGGTVIGFFSTVIGFFSKAALEGEHNLYFYLTGLGIGFFAAQVWNLFVPKSTQP